MKEIALIGTTASGKSALALELASKVNAVILSLDSLCVYKEIQIASAKPSKNELKSIKHFGIDLLSVSEEFSAGEFFKEYQKARDFATSNAKNLIITGGSGFYLKALLSGLAPKVPRAQNYPQNSQIYELCANLDEDFASKYSKNDTFRLQKWFDIFEFLKTQKITQNPSSFLKANTKEALIKNITIFNLVWQKESLKKRIAKRCEQMLEMGLLDEARELFSCFDNDLKALNSIGLKECRGFLEGQIKSQNELKELIITHTAQLAKRQRTFFASQFEAQSVEPEEALSVISKAFKF